MLFSAVFAPGARGQTATAPMHIVRISRGSFAPEKYETIKGRLDAAQKSLVPAIRQLAGCLHYFAAIDPDHAVEVTLQRQNVHRVLQIGHHDNLRVVQPPWVGRFMPATRRWPPLP